MRWPLREALIAYRDRLRHEALEQWRHDDLVWALLAPHAKERTNRPALPPILKGPPHGES